MCMSLEEAELTLQAQESLLREDYRCHSGCTSMQRLSDAVASQVTEAEAQCIQLRVLGT